MGYHVSGENDLYKEVAKKFNLQKSNPVHHDSNLFHYMPSCQINSDSDKCNLKTKQNEWRGEPSTNDWKSASVEAERRYGWDYTVEELLSEMDSIHPTGFYFECSP